MKTPNARARKEVDRLVATWKKRLYLTEWEIEVVHADNDAHPEAHPVGEGDVMAEVDACPVYLQAIIEIRPSYWKLSPSQREKAIVHELSHCLTQEIYGLLESQWRGLAVMEREAVSSLERLTQRIANIALSRKH